MFKTTLRVAQKQEGNIQPSEVTACCVFFTLSLFFSILSSASSSTLLLSLSVRSATSFLNSLENKNFASYILLYKGRGYIQVPYLQIRSSPQVQYLKIRSTFPRLS